MHGLKKVFSVYGSTGGLLLVLILLTGSVFYVLFGTFSTEAPQQVSDVRVAGISQGGIEAQIQGGEKVKIAILGEGYSKEELGAKAQQFISSLGNPAPYGNVTDFFEFIVVDNISTSGCVQSNLTCIKSPAIHGVVQQAMSATGAVGVVVLVNGGGPTSYSLVGLPGPAVINGSHIVSPGLTTHEFLGHMVGKLNDRYHNESAGGGGSLGINLSNCSRNSSGESWWKQADPNSTATISCISPDTFAPYINDCGAGKGNSNSVMSTGNCSKVNTFDPVEQYWLSHNIIPYLPKNGSTTTPPGGEVPTSCKCTEGWIRINGEDVYPFTGDCGQKYTDPDGVEWACTDSPVERGWRKLEPGMCMNGHIMDHATGKTLSWFYLGTNNQGVCGTDKKEYRCQNGSWNPTGQSCGPSSTNPTGSPPGTTPPPSTKTCDQLYQARGYQSYAAACQSINQSACSAGNSTGSCQCTPNCPGGTNPPQNSQYTLTSTTDKKEYRPTETIKLCYTIIPNKPFKATLLESIDGQADFQVTTWDASGNANECADLIIDESAPPGDRKFTIKAAINGQNVAQTSSSLKILGSASVPPGDNNPTATPSSNITPQITVPPVTNPPNNPPTTTTPAPGTGVISVSFEVSGIGTNTSIGQNNNPNPNPIKARVEITDTDFMHSTLEDFTYNPQTGLFTAALDNTPKGIFSMKLKTGNSLWKDFGIIQVNENQTTNVAKQTLITGDLNQDNVLDLLDYNIFVGCFGNINCSPNVPTDGIEGISTICTKGDCYLEVFPDLNNDGKVNDVDLNIFYSALSNRQGD